MIKNYIKIAWRNMARSKGYSALNILGLSIGMAVAILIGLWAQHEISYDSFHSNKDNIGIIMKKTLFNNEKGTQSGVMLPLYTELKANYPDVKYATRLDWGDNHSLIIGDKKLGKNGYFADPDFLRMFSFPLLEGNTDDALKDLYSIVLTKSLAKAIFGNDDPMGKTIKVDNKNLLKVSGVLKDIPDNSTLQFDFLMPYELNVATNDFVKGARDQWKNNFLQTFVQLKENVSMKTFSSKIENLARAKSNDTTQATLFVHPMEKWHLYGDFKDWKNVGGLIQYVQLFALIGLLVLIIACINFMNLSTARSEKRAREVGIRKAIGSRRNQLIVQFLSESVVTAFIAFIVSLIIVKVSLPFLSDVGFNHIVLNVSSVPLLSILLAGCLFTGILAGSYPALYLSQFNPVKVLKGTYQGGKSANLPRKILVVTQFTFSIALIIGTVIIFQQIRFAKSRSLGYNPNNLLSFSLSDDLLKNYDPMKRDLISTGYVEAVTRSSSPMTGVYNQWDDFSWEGKDPSSHPLFSAVMVDYDYDKVTQVRLKAGRFFSKDFATDSSAVILNEASVKLMGLKKPIGKAMRVGEQPATIIGVIDNVMMQDPFKSVQPAVLILRPYFRTQGLLRFKKGADIKDALAAIKPVMHRYNPGYPFTYRFTDEEFNKKFEAENQVAQLSGVFAALAIFISCLGLLGLASFMAERRKKEIGVRKVLGASISQLWMLLSKEFVLLILLSCVIASPIALYFLQGWLEKYEYHINISPLVFIGGGVIAVVITLVTVSFQAIKAAIANPVKSLRTE